MLLHKPDFTIILSRVDSIGDVVLTLPMAGLLKRHFPRCRIVFLGRNYTRDVVALSEYVDQFVSYDDLLSLEKGQQVRWLKSLHADCIVHVLPDVYLAGLAFKARIPLRVGTTNRVFHWPVCNELIRLSRRKSSLHEAQLNIQLLSFLGIDTRIPLDKIADFYGFSQVQPLEEQWKTYIPAGKKKVILHPKSKGSAKEWGLANFSALIRLLPAAEYEVYISGTREDGLLLNQFIAGHPHVVDLTGKLSLTAFISFINACDVLVAASTGPLHIAAALGKRAVGLFSSRRPIHPGRWMPLGKQAVYLVDNESCVNCQARKDCDCITRIAPERVKQMIDSRVSSI